MIPHNEHLEIFCRFPSRTIIVRDLPFSCTTQDLEAYFRERGFEGISKIYVCFDRRNSPLHYGYVLFDSEDVTRRALGEIHGQRFRGRDLRVQPFDSLAVSQASTGGDIHVHFHSTSDKVPMITEETLRNFLERFGQVKYVIVRKHHIANDDTHVQHGFGFVTFADPSVHATIIERVKSSIYQSVVFDCTYSHHRGDPTTVVSKKVRALNRHKNFSTTTSESNTTSDLRHSSGDKNCGDSIASPPQYSDVSNSASATASVSTSASYSPAMHQSPAEPYSIKSLDSNNGTQSGIVHENFSSAHTYPQYYQQMLPEQYGAAPVFYSHPPTMAPLPHSQSQNTISHPQQSAPMMYPIPSAYIVTQPQQAYMQQQQPVRHQSASPQLSGAPVYYQAQPPSPYYPMYQANYPHAPPSHPPIPVLSLPPLHQTSSSNYYPTTGSTYSVNMQQPGFPPAVVYAHPHQQQHQLHQPRYSPASSTNSC